MTTYKDMQKWEPWIAILKASKITQLAMQKWMAVVSSARELNVLKGIKPTTEELNLIKSLKYNGSEINHYIEAEDHISVTTALKGAYPTPAYVLGINDSLASGLTANDATERMFANNHLMITVNSITLSTELMPNQVDRDFSGASAWADVDLNAYDETGDLTITADGANQYCTLVAASAPTVIGRGYSMTFDVANIVSTWTIKSFDGTQDIGTVSANGTAVTLSWTAETVGGYRIVADSGTSSADFDNFTLTATVHGGVLVTGDSMSEASGVPTIADTEYMVIDRVSDYQTDKKWYRITSIVVLGSGITAIDYDISNLGYWDALNNNFSIHGYRIELTPTNKTLMDFQLQLYKVQDNGGKRMEIVTLEDVEVSGTPPWVTDNLRTGSDARDYSTATATIFKVGSTGVMKQTDFEDYFSSSEGLCLGADKHEGLIMKITWDNVDYMTGLIAYHHRI